MNPCASFVRVWPTNALTTFLAVLLLTTGAPSHGQTTDQAATAGPGACVGDNGGITLSPGFCATVFADKVGHARHLAVAPNGIVYVNTWSGRYYHNDTPPPGGFLIALQDTNGGGLADKIVRFGPTKADGNAGGTGVALYKGYLYAESNDRIVVSTTDGSTLAAGKQVKVSATVWAYSSFTSDHLDLYYTANANSARVAEAIQGYMRKVGVHWQLQPWDSTIASVKMAEQDYEIWSVTVPYLSAGDLMNIYFDSANIPTPNRMNWKDAETDDWLKQGRAALTPEERARFYAMVQQKVMNEHLWMPVLNINMHEVTNKKLKGMRPHMIYQNTFYKGLDASF